MLVNIFSIFDLNDFAFLLVKIKQKTTTNSWRHGNGLTSMLTSIIPMYSLGCAWALFSRNLMSHTDHRPGSGHDHYAKTEKTGKVESGQVVGYHWQTTWFFVRGLDWIGHAIYGVLKRSKLVDPSLTCLPYLFLYRWRIFKTKQLQTFCNCNCLWRQSK